MRICGHSHHLLLISKTLMSPLSQSHMNAATCTQAKRKRMLSSPKAPVPDGQRSSVLVGIVATTPPVTTGYHIPYTTGGHLDHKWRRTQDAILQIIHTLKMPTCKINVKSYQCNSLWIIERLTLHEKKNLDMT